MEEEAKVLQKKIRHIQAEEVEEGEVVKLKPIPGLFVTKELQDFTYEVI